MYIYELQGWPKLHWNRERIAAPRHSTVKR